MYMNIIDRLLDLVGLQRAPKKQKYSLDTSLNLALSSLAEKERIPADELASSLVASGLAQESLRGELWKTWLRLSMREQQVTALTCLGYTNPQMAARLGLGVETIKSHTQNVHRKFDVATKADLRVLLAEWDFSEWQGGPGPLARM